MGSRAEFEEFWRKEMNIKDMPLCRTNFPMTEYFEQAYICHETNRSWISWQASRRKHLGEVMDSLKARIINNYTDKAPTAKIAVQQFMEAIRLESESRKPMFSKDIDLN